MIRTILSLACCFTASALFAANKPNVVLVITDDQGYGDLSCHGNPILKTPHIDALHGESVRLTDYHVSPTCSPTRAALLTGHWTNRTGVWHTIQGRSMLRENEVTVAQVFKDNGYVTGMFGKWHLGDNHPFRPDDRGFTEVLRHGGGGVGQTPDYWDNAYFDGSYWHNGVAVPAKGYCTDVFFDYATQFIRDAKKADKPFFAYISTNTPHSPHHAPPESSAPYEGKVPAQTEQFFGMIANIDDNVGALRKFLDDEGLTDNTLFIFTTDNGTAGGDKIHNNGMRGKKGSQYDGGHRVPFIAHWPHGGYTGGRDVTDITAHVDILPTFIDLFDLTPPEGVTFDGVSIRPLLDGKATLADGSWPDRMLVTDSQRVKDPIKWKACSVMSSQWRLIDGKELYDIKADPGQKNDIAKDHPAVVKDMRAFYEAWWADISPSFANAARISIGHAAENPARLTSHDWITSNMVPWNQAHIRSGETRASHTGFWYVDVKEAGAYSISLSRWPPESKHGLTDALPPGAPVPGLKAFRGRPGKGFDIAEAAIDIAGVKEREVVDPTAHNITFDVELPAGPTKFYATFKTSDGTTLGAYFAVVEKK